MQAVDCYSKIVKQFPGLGLTERARIRKAVLLYETGQVDQAIVELDDEEVALRGNAEVASPPSLLSTRMVLHSTCCSPVLGD